HGAGLVGRGVSRTRHFDDGGGACDGGRRRSRFPHTPPAGEGLGLLSISALRTHFFTPHGVVRAVDGASIDVDEGEAVGIVGESGSGKSMTALSVARLVPSPGRIVDGSITFAGRDLLTLGHREMQSVRANDIAMI